MNKVQRVYVTVLATDDYLGGVLVIHRTLKDTRSKYPLHVCVTPNLSGHTRDTLVAYGIPMIEVTRRDSPKMPPFNKWRATYTKLEIFKLTQYSKLVYIDADMIVLKNIDHLFEKPHMSGVAAGCWGKKDFNFNSGLLVIEPNVKEYDALVDISIEHGDTCQGDQNVLQKYFTEWPRQTQLHLGMEYNIFASQIGYTKGKYHIEGREEGKGPSTKPLFIIHFVTPKPWTEKDEHMISQGSKFLYDMWHKCHDRAILSYRP